MNQEQIVIGYDDFFLKPIKERINAFNKISAENRALLIKTHVERWLAANRSRLTREQIAVVEEIIRSISPGWYEAERSSEKIEQQAETLRQKAEAVLTAEDVFQIMSNRAKYVPSTKNKND